MNEKWKLIVGLPNYVVSSLGNVKNIVTGNLLAGSIDHKGYKRYDLSLNGKRIVKSGHRLVAEAFLPPTKDKNYVNHIDGNKTNNCVDNLEWCTCQENVQHAVSALGVKPVNRRSIRCVETGVVFPSAYEAERVLGIKNSLINRCCNGLRKSTHHLHFEFID